MKNKIVLLFTGCMLLILSSCLSSNTREYEMVSDCRVFTFTLAHDSIAILKTTKFTIDQQQGRIYNADSLPFGTVLDTVLCTTTFGAGTSYVAIVPEVTGDTIYATRTDSVDFSKPVKIISHAYDGITNKAYMAQVNIHQVNPDSMAWKLYAENVVGQTITDMKVLVAENGGSKRYLLYVSASNPAGYQLYTSSVGDDLQWSQVTLAGLPAGQLDLSQVTILENYFFVPATDGSLYCSRNGQGWDLLDTSVKVKTLLGAINPSDDKTQVKAVAALVEENGQLLYASIDTNLEWNIGGAAAAGFPVSGFATYGEDHYSYNPANYYRLLVAAGRDKDENLLNTVWTTFDGLEWMLLTDQKANFFQPKEGAMLTRYDDKYYLIGGINKDNKATKEMHFSIDKGVSWAVVDSLVALPDVYQARGFASIYVDDNDYMLIFGGKESRNGNVLDQIWRGRINRLGFPQK